jgi:hypothetical protein
MESTTKKTGFLFNTCYGGFGLTKECCAEYKERTGKEISRSASKYSPLRYDPVLLQLFEEKGSKWMSDEFANIALYPILEELIPYICVHEYDGQETVGIDFQHAQAHALKIFRESVKEDLSNLTEAYVAFDTTLKQLEAMKQEQKILAF